MNKMNRPTGHVRFVLCSALAVTLAGCTTYVDHRPARTVYVPPPVTQPPPVVVTPAEPPVVVIQTESDFYEPLSVHGEWVVVGSYGRCWRPARVEVGWRPYANGHWERTDAGWYWASDEPWGWATYHYGRWDFSVNFGWVWVPHTQWAPAWVSWRQGAGYVGWAPLPPSARIGSRGIIEVREATSAPRAFVFVSEQRLLEPVRPATVIVNNTTVINQTVNITQVQVVNNRVINEGPRPEIIERKSGRKINALPVHELRHKEETEVAARQRIAPGKPEKTVPLPESGPVKAVPARELGQADKPAEVVKQPQLPTTKSEVRQPVEQKPAPTPGRPETERPARSDERRDVKSERNPAIPAEAASKPEAKPRTVPRETRRPSEVTKQPQPPLRQGGTRGAAESKSPEKPARPEGARPPGNERQRDLERAKGKPEAAQPSSAARKPMQPPVRKQVTNAPAKGKPAAVKTSDTKKKKDNKKKSEEQETPQTNAPPRSPQ